VNLENECPLWAQEAICKEPGNCDVCRCEEEEVSKYEMRIILRFQSLGEI